MDEPRPSAGADGAQPVPPAGSAPSPATISQRFSAGISFLIALLVVLAIAGLADRTVSRLLWEGTRAAVQEQAYGIARSVAGQLPAGDGEWARETVPAVLQAADLLLKPQAAALGLESIRLIVGESDTRSKTSESSAYAPILDPRSGQILGVVECSGDLTRWRQARSRIRRQLLAGIALILGSLSALLAVRMRWRRTSDRPRGLLHHAETLAAALCGAGVAVLANRVAAVNDGRTQDDRLAGFRRRAAVAIEELIDTTELFLESAALFFEGSDTVTDAEFRAFVSPLIERIGAENIAWHPRVPRARMEAFQSILRTVFDGRSEEAAPAAGPSFEAAEDDTDGYPTLYRAGPSIAAPPVGYDMGSEDAARAAIREARALRRPIAVRGTETSSSAGDSTVLIFYPVRKPPSERSWDWSRDGVLSVRIPLALWAERAAVQSATGERLLDVWVGDPLPAGTTDVASALPLLEPVLGFGRLWMIRVLPQPAFYLEYGLGHPWRRHVASGLLVAVLTVGVARSRGYRARLESAVEARTAELRKRETELADSERRYRQLFEEMSDGFALHEILLDEQGKPCDYRFLEVNPAFERMTGLRANALVGKTLRETLPDIEPCWIERYGRVALTGEPARFEHYAAPLKRHYEVNAYRPSPGRFATVFQDITARKEMEQERLRMERKLMQSQRLESLGLLAGGVAHDFNNLLMAILGNAELAEHHLTQPSVVTQHLTEIATASRRAADLCRQMLAYAGKGRIAVGPVDVNALTEELVHLLRTTISRRALLNLRLESGLPSVLADASQVRQVIMNLVINASEALEEKSGTISITTGMMHCDRSFLDGALFAADAAIGLYVWIEVADTGCGMDAATVNRIFDPFFTTKFAGRGLGLSTVMGIVRGHRGALKVYSEPGRGTVFKVFLPAVSTVSSASPAAATETVPWRGTGTVLLADDEPSVRAIGAALLENLGFQCVAVADGVEATETLRQNPGAFTSAIVDLTMPRVGGELTRRRLHEIRPDLPVYLASGYSAEELEARLSVKGFAGFIQKPYSLKDLRELLSRPPLTRAAGSSIAGGSRSTVPDGVGQNPQ